MKIQKRYAWLGTAICALILYSVARGAMGIHVVGTVAELSLVLIYIVVFIGVVLSVVQECKPWLVSIEDMHWLKTLFVRWHRATVLSACLVIVLFLDFFLAVSGPATEQNIPVQRVACTRISPGNVKVTIDAPQHNSEWCFLRNDASSQIQRVDRNLVKSNIQMNMSATLKQNSYNSMLFGKQSYIHAVEVQ